MEKKLLNFIAFGLVAASLAISGMATTMQWGIVDADISIAGLGDAKIILELGEYSGNYDVQTQAAGGGLLGGVGTTLLGSVGGGILGGAPTASSAGNRSMNGSADYLTGMGRLNNAFGLLFVSFKDVYYKLNIQTFHSTAKLTVHTHTDTIPWYPEGIGQRYTVTITLNEALGNFSTVDVNKVWIRLNYAPDPDEPILTYTKAKKIGETSPGSALTQANQSVTYTFDVSNTYDKERIGVIGLVELTLHDTVGGSYSPSLPPTPTINIRPTTQMQAAQVVMLGLAFPMTVIGLALGAASIPLALLKKRLAFFLCMAAFIVSLLGVIFFYLGGETLIGMLEAGLTTFDSSSFRWTEGITTALTGALLLAPAAVLMWIAAPPKPEKKGRKSKKKEESPRKNGKEGQDGAGSEGEADRAQGMGMGDGVAPDNADDGAEELFEMKLVDDNEPLQEMELIEE